MITFRVTEDKIKEYLGKSFTDAIHPFRSRRINLLLISNVLLWSGVAFLPGYYLLERGFHRGIFLMFIAFVLIGIGMIMLIYFTIRSQFWSECVPKMRELVTDQQLLWLNSITPDKTVTRWSRTPKNKLSEVNFLMLAFLKKHGTSQAFYKTVQSMGSSNSAAITFKRLARKVVYDQSIIQKEGSDFKYVPWEFKIVDKNNKAVATTEIAKMEKLLNKLWEKLIDNYLNEEMG